MNQRQRRSLRKNMAKTRQKPAAATSSVGLPGLDGSVRTIRQRILWATFSSALLISAVLLFSAQPMIGKMVLPLYGGAPAVWTTCMVFYQVWLLAGYAYAHLLCRWLSFQLQLIVHLLLLGVALLWLPMKFCAAGASLESQPVASLLVSLALTAGVPFFLVTTTASLLQRWFVGTNDASARDPYVLYAVSNFGSLMALVAYPFVIEPILTVSQQTKWWAVAYVVLAVNIAVCALLAWRGQVGNNVELDSDREEAEARHITVSDRFVWISLSFLPSSWMLAVTTRLTTNIAPFPLLWMIPLALYLLTYILAFLRRPVVPRKWLISVFSCLLVLLTLTVIIVGRWQLLLVHLSTFFVGAMLCHGELARRRPPICFLTEFYWWIAVGGCLGGVFNALLAPILFPVHWELPVTIALTCLVVPWRDLSVRSRRGDFATLMVALGLGAAMVQSFAAGVRASPSLVFGVIVAAVGLVVACMYRQAKWCAIIVAVILAWELFDVGTTRQVVHRARSFFGIHHVAVDLSRNDPYTGELLARYRRLFHGTTQHGCQSLDPNRECEPLQYYHPSGPLGQIFDELTTDPQTPFQGAVIGLGTGAAACYASPFCELTFYEVDPVVLQLAENDEYFSYLGACGAEHVHVVLGDGRLRMESVPDRHFELILLDAFSSEAIPAHLVTREAIELYMRKLTDTGLLAFHISNRYVDLSPVLAAVADEQGYPSIVMRDVAVTLDAWYDRQRRGIDASTYVVMAKRREHFRGLSAKSCWRPLAHQKTTRVWTDQYSSILNVLRWNPSEMAQSH